MLSGCGFGCRGVAVMVVVAGLVIVVGYGRVHGGTIRYDGGGGGEGLLLNI